VTTAIAITTGRASQATVVRTIAITVSVLLWSRGGWPHQPTVSHRQAQLASAEDDDQSFGFGAGASH
jgi:hypothetical protein